MTTAPLALAGTSLLATLSGALVWPDAATLVVADLHLEKGSSVRAAAGVALPPYDSRATLSALAAVIEAFRPERVICLGDSFHDRGGPERLAADDWAVLKGLAAGRDWVWVEGNHDGNAAAALVGRAVAEIASGPLIFRHQAAGGAAAAVTDGAAGGTAAGVAGEVSGHFHPRACVSVLGRRVSGRCFATDGRRLLLPSFGAYTGGLDVLDPAITGLFARPFRVLLLGQRQLHSIAAARLQPFRMPAAGRPDWPPVRSSGPERPTVKPPCRR